MLRLLPKIYTADFYAKHKPWKRDYVAVARALAQSIDFSSALDLGCGNAYIAEELQEMGKVVRAIDGSDCALEAMAPLIRQRAILHDLTIPITVGKFDLVICTEVAEHLPARSAQTLVKTICSHFPQHVFFTAATPGQRGHFHLNEQPHSYWKLIFSDNGYVCNEALTESIQNKLSIRMKNARWIARNTMIFVPCK